VKNKSAMKYPLKTSLGERLDQSGLRAVYHEAVKKRQVKRVKEILKKLELEEQIPTLLEILHLDDRVWYQKLFYKRKK